MPITLNGDSGIIGGINSGTAVASTSGTSIDFTGIPSGVKRITVMFNGVSTNGSSTIQVQVGSGSVSTSGYTSSSAYAGATNAAGGTSGTSGFLTQVGNAAALSTGHFVITNISGTTWVCSHVLGVNVSGTIYMMNGGGTSPALSGTLDRVRITTSNGTDTFDAGSINILYE